MELGMGMLKTRDKIRIMPGPEQLNSKGGKLSVYAI